MEGSRLDNGAQVTDLAANRAGRRLAWGSNFSVEWIAAGAAPASFDSDQEAFVILGADGGQVEGPAGVLSAATYAVALAPPGRYVVTPGAHAPAIILATGRPDLRIDPSHRDERVAPLGPAFPRKRRLEAPQLVKLEDIPFPPDNPRLKFLQSATMSINLVLYDGERSRTALSPHAHADFEQCSLAVEGDFIHHLRVPWGPNANDWKDDTHLAVHTGAALIIPPHLVHTTEGVGSGVHFLIDLFAPPRPDFIARGWIANAEDYRQPEVHA